MPDRVSWFIDGRPVRFGDWSADAVAQGGYRNFQGVAPGHLLFAEQEAEVAGFRRDGSPFWFGKMTLDPEITDGGANIYAEGVFLGKFSTQSGRRFFMSRDEAAWKNQEVKPFGYNNVGRLYQSKIEQGHLVWWAPKGEDASVGDTTGWVFWAEDAVLTNVKATTAINNGANPNRNEYQISTGFGPSGGLTVEQNGLSVTVGSFDVPLNKTTGDLVTIEVRRNNNASPADKIQGRVFEIELRGLATSSVFTLDQVLDIILKVDTGPVTTAASALDVMPLDWVGTDFDLANYLTDVGDWFYLILHRDEQGTHAKAGPWGQTTIQVARRSDARTQLAPLRRYNRVRVPWTNQDDAQRFAVADASPDPFPGQIVEFMLDALEDKFPNDSDVPQSIADTLIRRFSAIRRTGSVEVGAATFEGKRLSPFEVMPGMLADIVDHEPGIPAQRIQAVSWDASGTAKLSIEREDGAVKTLRQALPHDQKKKNRHNRNRKN